MVNEGLICRGEPHRRVAAKMLTKDEALRIAVNYCEAGDQALPEYTKGVPLTARITSDRLSVNVH
jgi:hypothetical protein